MADSRRIDPRRLLGLVAVITSIVVYASVPDWTSMPSPPNLVVDPNSVPPEVLAALPNLGPARVRAIEIARAKAPFRSAEDLDRKVKGIGPATIAELKPFLRFDSSSSPLP